MKAKFDQETRDFIEGVFKSNNYSLEQQICYLRTRERQKYNYYCDRTNGGWNWTPEDDRKFNAEWDEIIDMIDERTKEAV